MNILGLSAFVHDSAACLIKNGKLIAGAEEERFNRIKHTSAFPVQSITYVLNCAGVSMSEIDAIAYNWNPCRSFIAETGKFLLLPVTYYRVYRYNKPPKNFLSIAASFNLRRTFNRYFSDQFRGKIFWVDHHSAHAASCYYLSPFCNQDADVLVMDAHGEDCSASVYSVKDSRLCLRRKIPIFDSLGIIYSNFTRFLGFDDYQEGKTMALASYGNDSYKYLMKEIIRLLPEGRYTVRNRKKYLSLHSYMKNELASELGKKRGKDEPLEQRHFDIACSMQNRVKEAILHMVRHVAEETGQKKLALSGGLFLNCDINRTLIMDSGYEQIFVPPFASDAGGGIGAGLYTAFNCCGEYPEKQISFSPYLGPEYSNSEILEVIKKHEIPYKQIDFPWINAARDLKKNRVIGWFQGRMESGPRALGNRSILANAFSTELKDYLNSHMKKRESFRPFGPITTAKAAYKYFDFHGPLPESTRFMLMTAHVKPEYRDILPGITHVDGTARIQVVTEKCNKLIYRLLVEFEKITGYAVLINTSFNCQAPIVCTPADALLSFQSTPLQVLYMGNFRITK